MIEQWKPIPGYEGYYEVSDYGNVKSLARIGKRKDGTPNPIKEKILKPCVNSNGYYYLNLCKDGNTKNVRVHRLVAISFLNSSDLQVNHRNGIKTDNRLENLEWVSRSDNSKHAYALGLNKRIAGEKHPFSKLTQDQANEIRRKYVRWKYPMMKLAEEYNVNDSIIRRIVKNRSYAV